MSCDLVEIVRAHQRSMTRYTEVLELERMVGSNLATRAWIALNAADLQFKRELLELLGEPECDG